MYFCLIRRPYSLLRSFRLVLALASQANSCPPTSLLLHPLEGLATYACLTHVVRYYAYIHACFRCTEQLFIYIYTLYIYLSLSLSRHRFIYGQKNGMQIYTFIIHMQIYVFSCNAHTFVHRQMQNCRCRQHGRSYGPIACLHRRLGPGSLLSDQPLSAHDLAMLTLNILNSCWRC